MSVLESRNRSWGLPNPEATVVTVPELFTFRTRPWPVSVMYRLPFGSRTAAG